MLTKDVQDAIVSFHLALGTSTLALTEAYGHLELMNNTDRMLINY